MIVVSIKIFLLFIIAWICANILLEILKGKIRQHQAAKLVDTVYLKVSKLLLAVLKDVKNNDR